MARKPAPGGVQLNAVAPNGAVTHFRPTPAKAALRAKALNPAVVPQLTYHGGKVMTLSLQIRTIFWTPPKLQNGTSTSMTMKYKAVQNSMVSEYPGHGLANINTQYYQKTPAVSYILNSGFLSSTYTDTSPYPASSCTDTATPGNCLTQQQVVDEITKVMTLKGWTGGMGNLYLLYTSKGEGSCFDSSSTTCAYTFYCAYHSSFTKDAAPVIYGYEPYGDTNFCQIGGVPSPNGDADSDTAATAASHEMSEAITDPFGNAWFDSNGDENGDKCIYTYGTNTWKAGTANQMWDGHYFELQREFSNHTNDCLLVGP